MSDTSDPQVIEPITSPPPIPNFVPYILQRLKELYDRIQSDELYAPLSSQNTNISEEDNDSNTSTFKLAFLQAIDTLLQHTVFVQARQEDWVHKFERMRQIASQWPNPDYYEELIQTAEHAFMDVLEWIRTNEEESANYTRTYAVLFNINVNLT